MAIQASSYEPILGMTFQKINTSVTIPTMAIATVFFVSSFGGSVVKGTALDSGSTPGSVTRNRMPQNHAHDLLRSQLTWRHVRRLLRFDLRP